MQVVRTQHGGKGPDTINLPGNTYTEQQNANVQARMELDTTTGTPGNSLKTGFNDSAHLQYSNSGTPTVPITLSIDAQINTLAERQRSLFTEDHD